MSAFTKSESPEEHPPNLVEHRVVEGHETAIVFVHGFSGDLTKTWGKFPRFLMEEPDLDEWDVLSVGYATNLRLDLARIWSASPPLDRLALLLRTLAKGSLHEYKSLAFIAHSMGGLIVQRALVDDSQLTGRTSHVLLFGTPSNGLAKAGLAKFWKRQLRDMAAGGKFIKALRSDWTSRFPDGPPFGFLAIAGSEDEFVPSDSSLSPFAEDFRAVVHGDHLDIVKPVSREDLSVQVVVRQILGDAAPAGPWNSARVAVEKGEFRQAIEQLEPHKAELDEDSLVHLALALEAMGRGEEALQVVEEYRQRGMTDAMGVLAGRLKRRWLATGVAADAKRAYELYQEAKSLALGNDDAAQVFYHAINVAFLEFAYRKKTKAAAVEARLALDQARRSGGRDRWALATEAEAFLYLGELERALSSYREAVAAAHSPREIESMFHQATKVARILNDTDLVERLAKIFRGDLGTS